MRTYSQLGPQEQTWNQIQIKNTKTAFQEEAIENIVYKLVSIWLRL